MSNTIHPSFPNPTIQEAICEIHFQLPEGESWQPSIYGRFFQHIQREFPAMEPVAGGAIQLQLQSGRMEISPPKSRMRYRHVERNLLLQLSENVLTVNMLPRYSGWQRLRQDIDHAWQSAQAILQPQGIHRIGLRYINVIPKQSTTEQARTWLAPNDYVGTAVLDSQPGFLSRVEVRPQEDRRAIVMVADGAGESNEHFILDIDAIAESHSNVFIEMDPTVHTLHEDVWTIFSAFLTPHYRNFLNQERAT